MFFVYCVSRECFFLFFTRLRIRDEFTLLSGSDNYNTGEVEGSHCDTAS